MTLKGKGSHRMEASEKEERKSLLSQGKGSGLRFLTRMGSSLHFQNQTMTVLCAFPFSFIELLSVPTMCRTCLSVDICCFLSLEYWHLPLCPLTSHQLYMFQFKYHFHHRAILTPAPTFKSRFDAPLYHPVHPLESILLGLFKCLSVSLID